MNRTEFLRILGRQKLVVLFTAAVVLAGGILFLAVQPRVYEATASVAVLPGDRLDQSLGAYDVVVAKLLPQYASIVRSQTFLDQVGQAVPGAGDARQLRSKIFARPDTTAAVLKLVAHDESPQRATSLARATLQQFLSQTQGTRIVNLQVIDQPRTPSSPVLPRRALVLGALPLVAVFLASMAAIAWNRLFGRIRDLDDLRAASGRRVVGALPYVRSRRRALFVGDPDVSVLDRSLRGIRTGLLLLRPSRPAPVVITVTSLQPGDGKSTLSANLAVAAAEVGLRVLILDIDTRRARQREIFQLADDRLPPVVQSGEDISGAVQATAIPGVSVLTLGWPWRGPTGIVRLYLHAVSRLRESADLVIVDGPSLSSDADLGLLAAVTDGVVLLVRAGTVPAQLRRALEGLDAVGVPVLGLVLSMSSLHAAARAAPYGAGPGPDVEPQPTDDAWRGRIQLPPVGDAGATPGEHPAGARHGATATTGDAGPAEASAEREPDETAADRPLEPTAKAKGTPGPPGNRSEGPAAPGRPEPP
jgi:Mrp family chromosome partitioning ATPase/capsular polysaccharide biosynthesis protein